MTITELMHCDTPLFHGGPAGLVGWILPAALTGARSSADYGPRQLREAVKRVHRLDRVYLTSQFEAAALFACSHPAPCVYVVQPDGALEPDPDCNQPGLSFACPRARIMSCTRLTTDEREFFLAALLHPSTSRVPRFK